MRVLIEETGVDLNSVISGVDGDRGKTSALFVASKKGHAAVVRLLIESGVDVNDYEPAALIVASQRGHIEVVNLLLEGGANLHSADHMQC